MRRAPSFDRIAPIYRWLEMATFGSALWRCRCAFLDDLRSCRNALVIGDGDGRFTARLLEINPAIRIDALDASLEMLRLLVRRAGPNANRVSAHQADARQWRPSGPRYDLVVTHFFLDCLTTEEVAALAQTIQTCSARSSRWIVSEFAIPSGWFGWLVARPLITALYRAFRLLTGIEVQRLPNYRHAMTESGFKLNAHRNSLGGLLVAESWVLNGDHGWQIGKPIDC